MLDDYTVRLPITPRFCDTDMLGHVNNAVYLSYFEAGRMQWWTEVSGDPSLEDLPFILARAEVDFVAEARAGEPLVLGLRCVKLGNKSFDIEYELVREADGSPVARGRSVQVMFDYRRRETRRIPDDVRRRIERLEAARPRPTR